jgi:hypothetical protein
MSPARKRPAPEAPRGRRPGPAALGLMAGLALVLLAAAPRFLRRPVVQPEAARGAVTVPVHLTKEQFGQPPTWSEVIEYYGLDPELAEPTRAANAGADGVCPPEPIALPHDAVIALSPGDGKGCRAAGPG